MSDNDNYFKDIQNTITNYLSEKNTDYGIMLTGEWGCGKTYFVKNLLKSGKYKNLHISISGKENISEIIDDIYLSSLIKKFNSNDISLNTTKTILNNVGGIFFDKIPIGKDIGKNILNIFKEINKNIDKLENVFLIIDDVERISKKINIEDLLYSIYDNFISNNVKVLFICNEEVLINNDEYNKIKEKIIRYTIKLHGVDSNNFIEFINTIKKDFIKADDINKYFLYDGFFTNKLIPAIGNIFMKMECYNMRTFFKFINMSKCFLYEINKYIDNKDFYLNYNEGLFLEILKNFAFVLISYDKNINTNILSNFDLAKSEEFSQKTNEDKSKITENFTDIYSIMRGLNLIYNNSIFYFYKYLECGLLNFEQIHLIYKDEIYLNKNVLKAYNIVSQGYESYDIIKENINIIFNEMKNDKDNFSIKSCWNIYKIVYIGYSNLFGDIKKDSFNILKDTLKYHWSITNIKTIYYSKIGYENNNSFFYPAFEVKINIKECDSNYNLEEYEKKLLDYLYSEKIKEIPNEFNEVLENFKCHNKDYFVSDFYLNSKILYLLFIPQNLKLIPRDVFSVRILLNFLYSDITIRNSFQEYKIYDYNATKVKDMVNNLKPFIDSIKTKDEYLLIRIAELKEKIEFYNNTDY